MSEMAYQIVAEREDLTVRMKQHSILFTLAKARIFASEGWSIVVTDSDGGCCTQRSTRRLLSLTPFGLPVDNQCITAARGQEHTASPYLRLLDFDN